MTFPLNPTKVVHCKRESFDVYIGRPSKWGNPFVIGKDGTREDAIRLYAAHFNTHPTLANDLHELRGKTLGCYCAPLLCHGHFLAALADATLNPTKGDR